MATNETNLLRKLRFGFEPVGLFYCAFNGESRPLKKEVLVGVVWSLF